MAHAFQSANSLLESETKFTWNMKTTSHFFMKILVVWNCFLSQLAHNVVTTLGFGCILVATSDNVVITMSQRCVSDVVTTTKN